MDVPDDQICPGWENRKALNDDALSGGRETGLYSLVPSASGHDLSLANILYSRHHRGLNRSAFAVYGLQFYEDGRKIALYANTLPGSFFLREEVV